MVDGSEELACSLTECYPMIVFFVCFACFVCGSIGHIINILTSSESNEQKKKETQMQISVIISNLICCSIPIFFIIRSQCIKLPRDCNPAMGWVGFFVPTLIGCVCVISCITFAMSQFT